MGGLTVGEALAAQAQGLKTRLKQAVRTAAGIGQVPETVADTFRRKARDLAVFSQTWIGSLAKQIHYAAGKANPRVKGWRHLSVLDGRTGSVCLSRHGKTWDKSGMAQGHGSAFALPPLHINCRSRLVSVFDLDEPFDGMDGGAWVKRRTLAQLQAQFGKGVGQMLYDGEIGLADAVKSGGLVPMTLRELKAKRADALAADLQARLKHSKVPDKNLLDKSVRSDWNSFPDVVLMNSKTTIAEHRFYQEAKAGNVFKAVALVDDYLREQPLNDLKRLVAKHGDVYLLPVHALEATGKNALPVAYTAWLERYLNAPVEYGIVQADFVGRTGADGFERLVKSVRFNGEVTSGRKYLLIDDAVTQGGTLADLKGYIESQGGIAVGATTLMGKPHSARLAVTKPTLGQLRKFVGKDFEAWWQEEFGYDFSKLTESEARYINKQIYRSGIDTVRDTIIARRLEAVGRKSP
ncbi:hypothetical protein V6667_02655 [Neisseria leonii]|uniref:hypothetical protein n=1 Tax=Neisseria leonii TaxID=2995413 RepID=UPI0030CF66E8